MFTIYNRNEGLDQPSIFLRNGDKSVLMIGISNLEILVHYLPGDQFKSYSMLGDALVDIKAFLDGN